MTHLNDLTAIVALLMMGLVARGFWPHVILQGHSPVNYLMQGIFIGSVGISGRIALYDVIRPAMRYMDYMPGSPLSVPIQMYNSGFNIFFALAAWRILVGLHASLPESERDKYSWFTSPFYPKRINLFRRNL